MTKKKALIIVESPSKIKTLKKFLGENYAFESSVGHVRDLPEKELGIDLKKDFEPTYVILPGKTEVVKKLKKAASECDEVFLAPDPDREGEAIAWHISELLPAKTKIKRITFNSITKDAVLDALKHPRELDIHLVDAQQARRILDRLVGYSISPLLNRRIQRGKDRSVSAGRVQSVALLLVVLREKEILAFKPTEYWNITADLDTKPSSKVFSSYLYSVDGLRVEKESDGKKEVFLIENEQQASLITKELSNATYQVLTVEKKEKKRNPQPPFITSTLQQEASRHYGFSSVRTMSVAQELYEGIDLGNDGAEGLITYMRTDSTRIAPEAITEVREYIHKEFGAASLPTEPRVWVSKKNAQDAHEAIRPASLHLTPEQLKPFLTRDQHLLYELIWKRFIASQMNPAVYDTVTADISAGARFVVRATGSVLKFPGYLSLYQEREDEKSGDEDLRLLPPLEPKQSLSLMKVVQEQAFTRPPPRYTEASLVKELEKSGIGRPSTYATIMNKIQSREYTIKEQGRLKPTELGFVICDFLEANFHTIMDIGFTASMEDKLEDVAEGKFEWVGVVSSFWDHFAPILEKAEKEGFVPRVASDILCPKCGKPLQKIWFKSKYFYGCTGYPECDYSAPLEELNFKREEWNPEFNWDQPCPICGGGMKVRHGRFGPFLGCLNYPDCKGIINIPKKDEELYTPSPCPALECTGQLLKRTSRFGKPFYSCSTYPDCDVIGNSPEEINEKYQNHTRTPYVKKPSTRKGRAKPKADAASDKPVKKTTKPKKAAPKKTTKTVKKSSEKSKKE